MQAMEATSLKPGSCLFTTPSGQGTDDSKDPEANSLMRYSEIARNLRVILKEPQSQNQL